MYIYIYIYIYIYVYSDNLINSRKSYLQNKNQSGHVLQIINLRTIKIK